MKWSSVLHELKTITFGLILVIVFMIAVLPLLILHYCVNKLSKLFRPDLDCIVPAQDALFCKDFQKWHIRPDYTTIIAVHIDKEFSMTESRSVLDKFARQDLNYRRLRQRIEKWNGFLFWKNDDTFRIEDHVRYYPGEEEANVVRDKKWLLKAQEDLLREPYLKNKSPWEILWVPRTKFHMDDEKEFTVIIARVHHALADGLSAGRILELIFSFFEIVQPNFSSKKKGIVGKVFEFIAFLVKAPYVLADNLLTKNDKNKTPWNCDNYKFEYKSCLGVGKRISLPYIKSIKNQYNVSLNSVILLGASSLIRSALIRSKIKLPDVVHCLLPLPMANHPEELCSHVTAVQFEVPVGISDPEIRLMKIQEKISELKKSIAPQVQFLLGEIVGRLPFILLTQQIVFFLTGNIIIAPPLTDLPNRPNRKVYCFNFALSVPQPMFSSGFFICCSSSNSVLETVANFDKSIFRTNEEIERLFEAMYNDYKQLSGSEVIFVDDEYCVNG